MLTLLVITVLLVALAMALSVRHALEYPGKMRLGRDDYLVAQSIYHPGFTVGGFGEPLGVIATLVLTASMPLGSAPFWWSLAVCLAMASMHVVFWTVTQPVNRYWTCGCLPLPAISSGSRSSRSMRSCCIPIGGSS